MVSFHLLLCVLFVPGLNYICDEILLLFSSPLSRPGQTRRALQGPDFHPDPGSISEHRRRLRIPNARVRNGRA